MTVYMLRFGTPLGGTKHKARYYCGWCSSLDRLPQRLSEHRRGCGAAITRAAVQRGSAIHLEHIWPDADRAFERKVKAQKNHAVVMERGGNYGQTPER